MIKGVSKTLILFKLLIFFSKNQIYCKGRMKEEVGNEKDVPEMINNVNTNYPYDCICIIQKNYHLIK